MMYNEHTEETIMKKQTFKSLIVVIIAVLITQLLRLRPAKLNLEENTRDSLRYSLTIPHFTFHQNLIIQTYTGKDNQWELNDERINLYDIQGSHKLEMIVEKSDTDLNLTITNEKGTVIASRTYALKEFNLEGVGFGQYKVNDTVWSRNERDLFTIIRSENASADVSDKMELHNIPQFTDGFYLAFILD